MKKVVWTKEVVLAAVEGANTYGDILVNLGLSMRGRNNDTLKKYLALYEIAFVSRPHLNRDYNSDAKCNDDIFVADSGTQRSVVRNRIIKNKLLVYQCRDCGITDNWNGRSIVLQLEHINGISNDHRLTNLTFLCPNCHSQTSSWAGKGSTRTRSTECKPVVKRITVPKVSVLASLTVEELTALIEKNTFGAVGEMYGITDNAVRRQCKKLGIKLPGQGFRRIM
jgi:5-methylcytosine-specific restriction endonuclease McrA